MPQNEPIPPASSLDQVGKTLTTQPLSSREQFQSLYYDLSEVRQFNFSKQLKAMTLTSLGSEFLRIFLTGSIGCGKSTELRKYFNDNPEWEVVQFDITEKLDPQNFKPFDVLIYILAETLRRASIKNEEACLKDVIDWLSETENTKTFNLDSEFKTSFSLAKIFSLASNLRYSSRSETTVYTLTRMDDLVRAVNKVLRECQNQFIKEGKDLLIVVEGFDKGRTNIEAVDQFFITYGEVLNDLEAPRIFTVPRRLVFGPQNNQLPNFPRLTIPDIPIYTQEKKLNTDAVEKLKQLVAERIDLDLFEKGQLARLVVAYGGGNLRNLIGNAEIAAVNARADDSSIIKKDHTTRAINARKREFLGMMGELGDFKAPDKLARLESIITRQPDHDNHDTMLAHLVDTGLVLEINGSYWLTVHPIVVELINERYNKNYPGGLLNEDGEPR